MPNPNLSNAVKKIETTQERLLTMLSTALGPEIAEYLNDTQVVEIMVNPDGALWVERLGEGRFNTGHKLAPEEGERVIYLVATATDTICNIQQPTLSAELPGSGDRFQGMLPPVVSAPSFTIRKRASKVIPLVTYVQEGMMTEVQMNAIIQAISEKKNILIVGGTGSGKTTLLNATLNEIAKSNDRLIIIEDTQELQCTAPDVVFFRSCSYVTMNDLLRATLRYRPDRIIVGEVRGPEALTLLKSWNTGHPGGCATVHANNARGGLIRLEQLILEAIPNPVRELIVEAVNVIVYIERFQNSRRIREVVTVEGLEGTNYILRSI